jgi:hypothetical protein
MSQVAVLDVDIYKSSLLKESMKEGPGSPEEPGPVGAYHQAVDELAKAYAGKVWLHSGDGVIALFPSASRAVAAALDLLDTVGEINRQNAALLNGAVLFIRIGMHVTDHSLESVPPEDRGKTDSADLDLVGKLQKHCPIGRIAMSQEAYNAISFHRPLFRPTLIEEVWDSPILVLTERLITPQEEALFKGLPLRQKRGMPPIPFPSWSQVRPGGDLGLRTVPELLQEPLLVILGESAPEHGPIAPAATSDAVGVMEALAALRSNPDVRVAVDVWPGTGDLVSSRRNVVLVGAGLVNAYSFAINDIMPYLRFTKSGERMFRQLVLASSEEELRIGADTGDGRDAGFVSVSRSPFNAYQRLIWIAGVNGKATQAAALLLKDLVLDAAECLGSMGLRGANPIGCVVVPRVEPMSGGRAPGEAPYTKWWIKRYKPIWAVDDRGQSLRIAAGQPSLLE